MSLFTTCMFFSNNNDGTRSKIAILVSVRVVKVVHVQLIVEIGVVVVTPLVVEVRVVCWLVGTMLLVVVVAVVTI